MAPCKAARWEQGRGWFGPASPYAIQHHPPGFREAQRSETCGLSLEDKSVGTLPRRELETLQLPSLGFRAVQAQMQVISDALYQSGTIQVEHEAIGGSALAAPQLLQAC